jgi:hypothetical protein
VEFDPEEVDRIQRAQIAMLLHKLPSEIDGMPLSDFDDVLELHNANLHIEALKTKKAMRG